MSVLLVSKSHSCRLTFCLFIVVILFIAGVVPCKADGASAPRSFYKSYVKDTVTNDTTIYTKANNPPVYPDGSAALITFLGRNLRYPKLMLEHEIEGKVMVQFVVEKDGTLSNIKALRGPGRGSLEEAVRVVKKLPKWTPGFNEAGKPIRVLFQLPVIFALKDSDKNKLNNGFKVSVQ